MRLDSAKLHCANNAKRMVQRRCDVLLQRRLGRDAPPSTLRSGHHSPSTTDIAAMPLSIHANRTLRNALNRFIENNHEYTDHPPDQPAEQ